MCGLRKMFLVFVEKSFFKTAAPLSRIIIKMPRLTAAEGLYIRLRSVIF